MRTTVDLDDDLLQVARHLALEREQTLGRVLSDLARKGLRPSRKSSARAGTIPTLPRKPGARPVTSQMVRELLEAED
jgi:hypothetical protein